MDAAFSGFTAFAFPRISDMADILALINDVLQAIIVIFGSAVVLYNLGRSLRVPVIRAFSALITFVVIVYLTELLVSRTILSGSAETWLRVGWIGITLVPAAQYQLADALLTITGAPSRKRKLVMAAGYLIGLAFLGMVLWTDWIVGKLVPLPRAPHLTAGPLFPLFALFFWAGMAASIYHVWRARQRAVTRTTRQRITTTLLAFWAAPLAVFPYLVIKGSPSEDVPLIFWPVVILGNLVVGFLFGVMTSHLSYFGAMSPDRVVRVRLFKFMARVPLAGTIVLLVYILVSRNSPILGLPTETALGFTLVATVMLVEWLIHAYKRPLERLFQLNNDPDVYRIQQLSERLLTTNDLHQFLESVLAAACEALRTPTAFVAAITADGPKLEAVVGPLAEPETVLQDADWQQLAQPQNGNGLAATDLRTADSFILWQNYWIRPLHSRHQEAVIGIVGLHARADEPNLDETEYSILERLLEQVAAALEDRILQQQVFAAVEGILPQITALQERRGAARFGGLPILTAPEEPEEAPLVGDPGFTGMVRDALSHYWGGPKLTESPLMRLQIVQQAMEEHEQNPTNALRAILQDAIELQKPEGERNLSRVEWLLYNILEMKFVQGKRVRDVARRLAMSESDLYRKQRVAIENVARTIEMMETSVE